MFCRQCGHECPPEASFCSHCGQVVDSATAAALTTPADQALSTRIQTYLVLAIFSTALCCLPFGIPAIVFAVQARTRYQMGDREGAGQALDKARTWSWLSFGFGLIIPLFYLVMVVLAVVSEA